MDRDKSKLIRQKRADRQKKTAQNRRVIKTGCRGCGRKRRQQQKS